MAKNEVMATVRLTIGGVAASKKQLEVLTNEAERLKNKIDELRKEENKLKGVNADYKTMAPVINEISKLSKELKVTKTAIRQNENELNNYVNVLDNLAGTKLVHLQQALRGLQTQMKNSLTANDVKRYSELKAAYDQLMSSVDQLSGKMPNLTYVMKNLGQVADKTLADSIAYSEKLIASTDKTTKRGRDNIKAWSADLKAMRTEMSERSIKVLDNPQAYSVEQIQQSIVNLKKLQPVLKLSGQAWDDYAQKIKQGEEYLKSYDEKQKQIAEKEMRRKTNEVLANPAGFSQGEVEEAIRNAEKLQKAYKTGSPWWIHYKKGVDKAKESLDAYNKKQKEAEEANRKLQTLSVLNDPFNSKLTQQQLEDAIKHGKELQKLVPHMGNEWLDYANKIKVAEERLDAYKKEQKKVAEDEAAAKRKADTDAMLTTVYDRDVKFSEQQLETFVRNAKEIKKELEIGGTEWQNYTFAIEQAEKRLKAFNEEQKESSVRTKALTAINESSTVRDATTGAFNISANEAKERVEAIQEYMGTLNMSTQATEIREATAALEIYNTALGKVKDTTVDVVAILRDPKNFSTEEIQKAIKQLEETGLKIEVKDTDAIQQNIADIEKLKTVLADSAHSQTFIDQVIKDASEGKASVEDLGKAIAATKEKLRHTKDATMAEKLKQDLDQLNPKLELTKTSLARVTATLGNVKGANLGSLKEAAERLKVELNDVNLKMDDFAEKAAQLKKVNAQIKELEAQTKNVASAWDNAVSRLQNWVLIYAGSSEIWNKMVQAYQGTLKLSDAMTDVRKTTGLTADEVERLTDEVQELDTRITNEKLMEAATEAGRIGLKTRQEVLEFTRASAITLTALDELDARSITSVMKLNSLLGETARLGVQQAILSTASSINELSMASSAAQQPIIDFSRRFGGIAAQANISTAEVLGLGATIDALGQPIEMSSTALNKFTTALLSNGKQIAEDTGLSEEYVFKMTRQGKTIELMIEVLSKLNNMGGIGEISKYMGDMGGDGARMTAVVSALAANLGFLREQIDLSKMSFEEGISVINEYNLKNENAAALVARMGNEIKEVFVDSSMVSAVTAVLRVLQQLVHFMLSGTAAAKAFNAVLILIVTRMFMLNKTIRGWNDSLRLHIMYAREGTRAWISWSGALNLAKAGIVGLGKAIKGLFVSNPLGLLVSISYIVVELFRSLKGVEEQTEKTKSAIDRANEAFEEESYKLTKLRGALDEARGSSEKMMQVISTLNRDYGKQIGYVLDLAASYEEVAAAIDLATIAKRRQILEEEKANVQQTVTNDYRDRTNAANAGLKESLKTAFGKRTVGGEDFTEEGLKELYYAVLSDVTTSSTLKGTASLGENVDKVIRTQAKAKSGGDAATEERLYKIWSERLKGLSSVESVIGLYSERASVINEQTKEVGIQLTAQVQLQNQTRKEVIGELNKGDDLLKKAPRDFTASDENQLQGVIDNYENILSDINEKKEPEKWKAAYDEMQKYKDQQRQVLLAFVENPLRGIKMKVGEDGKLYKELSKDGRIQYEAVQEMSDANLEVLRQNYVRTEKTFQQLMSDYNHNMDSKVKEQAEKLSKVKTAIKEYLNKNGLVIDDKGNLTLRDTEYRDGSARTARQEDSEGRKAYEALLNNLKEYYEERKQLVLDDFVNGVATVEQKNRRIEEIERQHRDSIVAMQTELLGEAKDLSLFDEDTLIRNKDNWAKVLAWILKDTHHFQDKVRADRNTLIRENLDSMVAYKEERDRILLGNDYQAQVDKEMQDAFEKADFFWFGSKERTAENAEAILAELRVAAQKYNTVDADSYRKRLEENFYFGEAVKKMSKEEYAAFLVLLEQYHDKDLEARRKHSERIKKNIETRWNTEGFKQTYDAAKGGLQIENRKVSLEERTSYGAISDKEAYKEKQKIALDEWALNDWVLQQKIKMTEEEMAAATEKDRYEEYLMELKAQRAEREKEMVRQVTDSYMEEYSRRLENLADITDTYGTMIGDGLAKIALGEKDAGKELIKNLILETIQMGAEFAKRLVMEQAFGTAMLSIKNTQYAAQATAAYGAAMTEVGIEASKMAAIEAIAAGEITAQSLKQPDSILTFGASGLGRAALLIGLISAATAAAMAIVNSLFSGSTSKAESASSKRLATGMLTYASGRYPVEGDDGVTYDARYEPRLQTKIYQGGKGKAHMALFSEVMPEMVISGPTTKIIQEDFPALMNAILTIDKYGTLPQPRRMRRYEAGNLDEFDVDMQQGADGTFAESPAIAELRQSNAELRDTVARLATILENGIHANINMYGKGGIKESMDKANKFYTKNRIK